MEDLLEVLDKLSEEEVTHFLYQLCGVTIRKTATRRKMNRGLVFKARQRIDNVVTRLVNHDVVIETLQQLFDETCEKKRKNYDPERGFFSGNDTKKTMV